MTGEITLRGRVLPIGGLKEKVLAAHRVGIQTMVAPAQNARDLPEIPKKIREKLTFVWVESMDEVLKQVFDDLPLVEVAEPDFSGPPPVPSPGALTSELGSEAVGS